MFYTFEQFNYIVIITFMILLAIINLMNSYYKNTKPYVKLVILFINLMIVFNLLDCFIFMLITNEALILLLYLARIIIFLLISVAYRLLRTEIKKKESPEALKKMPNIYTLLLLIILVAAVILGKLNIIVTLALTLGHMFYVYFTVVKLNDYEVSEKIYEDVKKNVEDYVFITNASGNVVYENDYLKMSKEFDTGLYKNSVNEIFVNGIQEFDIYEHVFKSEDLYYQLIAKDIIIESKNEGMIFTIVNVTEVLEMLVILKEQEEALIETNILLKKSNENVYELEKEKEVDRILSEITETRLVNMKKISDRIKEIDINKNFDQEISDTIEEAKEELQHTRNVVNLYYTRR